MNESVVLEHLKSDIELAKIRSPDCGYLIMPTFYIHNTPSTDTQPVGLGLGIIKPKSRRHL